MKIRKHTYKPGDWKAECPVCGGFVYGSSLKEQWDGTRACPKCWRPRQPQDLVRSVTDEQAVPYIRKDQNKTAYTLSENRVATGYRTCNGSPSGQLTPKFDSEEVYDVTGDTWYKASGTTNTDWSAI